MATRQGKHNHHHHQHGDGNGEHSLSASAAWQGRSLSMSGSGQRKGCSDFANWLLQCLPFAGGRQPLHVGETRVVVAGWHRDASHVLQESADTHSASESGSDPSAGRSETVAGCFCDNRVVTSKYTLINFLPKNLFEQFRRIANFYFLCMMIIAYIPGVSGLNPITSLLPLLFVIGVTAIKQAFEDYQRHKADRAINQSHALVWHTPNRQLSRSLREGNPSAVLTEQGTFLHERYMDVHVGDVVKVMEGEEFPCDALLLQSAHEDGRAFVTTANLDGETTLKIRLTPRLVPSEWSDAVTCADPTRDNLRDRLVVECGQPHPHLYRFDGVLRYQNETEGLTKKNLLLKGSRLKNTPWVIALTLYTGRDTKMVLNQAKPQAKFSSLEHRLNVYLAIYFVALLFLCTAFVVLADEYDFRKHSKGFWPVLYPSKITSTADWAWHYVKQWLSFLLLLNWVIPISLYVTLELQKFSGSYFINWDLNLYDEDMDEPAHAHTSDLVEDLGQVEMLFPDKTGTLTQNTMAFKRCSAAGHSFRAAPATSQTRKASVDLLKARSKDSQRSAVPATSSSAASADKADYDDVLDLLPRPSFTIVPTDSSGSENISNSESSFSTLMSCLSLCHTVRVQDSAQSSASKHTSASSEKSSHQRFKSVSSNGSVNSGDAETSVTTRRVDGVTGEGGVQLTKEYQGVSADETALVLAAAAAGHRLVDREEGFMVVQHGHELVRYTIHHVLAFTSERMRMSVLLERNTDGTFLLITKGADNVVLERVSSDTSQSLRQKVDEELRFCSVNGLRTLVVARKILSASEANDVLSRLKQASEAMDGREEKLSRVYDEMERELELVGTTAVEDQLQQGVGETLRALRRAGINIWVLTGDKVETAISISISAGHFTPQHRQARIIDTSDSQSFQNQCQRLMTELSDQLEPSTSLLSYGSTRPAQTATYGNADESSSHKTVLIIDGKSLLFALAPEHRDAFRRLCLLCECVLCCRLSPLQKAEVVKLMKQPPPKTGPDGQQLSKVERQVPFTMAIGDGANDVAMLQQAHVGVGLLGKEGRQAAACSDYALARFELLRPLLLVHGHNYHQRIAYSVQYFFYKNLIYVIPIFYLQFFCRFSIQTLYEQWILTFYNVSFTSLPVLFYGVFEKDMDASHLLMWPDIYARYRKNRLLWIRNFLYWTFLGVWQGTAIFFGLWLLMQASGIILDLWLLGTSAYFCVLLIVTFKIAADTRHWTILNHVTYWGSIGLFVAFIFVDMEILNPFGASNATPGTYGIPSTIFTLPMLWAVMTAVIAISMVPDALFLLASRFFWPNTLQRAQKLVWQQRKGGNQDKHLRLGNATESTPLLVDR